MGIEFGRFILTGSHSIVIATDRDRAKLTNRVDRFDRIGAIPDDVATTVNRIVPRELRSTGTCFERFDVGVYVTQDEKAHGVS